MVTRTIFSPNKDIILQSLREGVVTVKFTKKDGTERDMKCTLQESYIAPYEKKTEREKTANDNNISVWDIENQGWRSFRVDSVISIYK